MGCERKKKDPINTKKKAVRSELDSLKATCPAVFQLTPPRILQDESTLSCRCVAMSPGTTMTLHTINFLHTLKGAALAFNNFDTFVGNQMSCASTLNTSKCASKCVSLLVGLLKGACQSPNFHFTNACARLSHCLPPSMHSLPGFLSCSGCT